MLASTETNDENYIIYIYKFLRTCIFGE